MEDDFLDKYFAQQREDMKDGVGNDEHALFQMQKVIDRIELLKEMEAIDSEGAFEKVKNRIKGIRSFSLVSLVGKMAAVLIIPLLILAVWQFNKLEHFKQAVVQNTITTPATLRSEFILPDGSKVWLNGGSTLKYPTQFIAGERMVELEGEAYFDVAHDKSKPFIVKAGNLLVEAVGTEFDCQAYRGESKVETVLTEGKVNIYLEGAKGRQRVAELEPDQIATYDKDNGQIKSEKIEPEKYIAWRDGKLIFKNDNIQDVLLKLGRWYNVEFVSDKPLKKEYAFTGSFVGEELTQILNYIELTTPVRFEKLTTEKNSDNLYLKTKIIIKSK
ncbi:MAG TPA: FecR domain-containing protein [Prolixibacteraceae bacterium]|nr:FecR domain-containing protein [Prolixibacteraceae bacterium]